MTNKSGSGCPGERYQSAAHRVQTAIAFMSDHPVQTQKGLRTGIDMAMSDAAGLAVLLIAKGVFTEEEYREAVAEAAEREADRYEAEMSQRHGANIKTV